jgi:hypothetical protein
LTNSRKLPQNRAAKNAIEAAMGTLKHMKHRNGANASRARVKPQKLRSGRATQQVARTVKNLGLAHAEQMIATFDPLKSRPQKCSAALWRSRGGEVRDLMLEAARTDTSISIPMGLSTLTGFLVWVEEEHLEGSLRETLTAWNIDRYAARFARAAASRRHTLRKIAAAAGVPLEDSQILIAKPDLNAPYTDEDLHALIEFAENLTNEHRSKRLLAGVFLGAGAGLVRGTQTGVCRGAIHRHSEKRDACDDPRIFLRLDTHCRPIHPLLTRSTPILEQLFRSDELLAGSGRSKNRHNKPKKWVPANLPEYNPDQLRATYVKWVLDTGYPLKDALLFCDLKTVSGLTGYIKHLNDTNTVCVEK